MTNDIEFTEREKCCICNNSKLHFEQFIYAYDYDASLNNFKLLKCNNCGMYYTSPYPNKSTITNLYNLRDSNQFQQNDSMFFKYLKNILAELQILKQFKISSKQKLKILDFGCGDGRWALVFQKVFPYAEVSALDFMPEPPKDFLNKKKKVPEYICIKEFYNDNKKYDVIFLRHVVEHVENPKEFLNKLLDRLTKTGYIYIEVPNIQNGLKKFFDKYLPSYYPPYHLVHFTEENIINLFKELNVKYEISYTEMPLMSNIIANMRHEKLNNIHRIFGMLLNPIQLILCMKKHTVIVAKIRKK